MLEFGKVKPMLCTLKVKPLDDPAYVYERKFDGFRALAFVNKDGSYRLQARSLTDKTALFPELKFVVNRVCVLDGEVTCSDEDTRQSFEAVQHRVNNPGDVRANVSRYPAHYHAFDMLEDGEETLTEWPLAARKRRLLLSLAPTPNVTRSVDSDDGERLFEFAKERHWEGVVGKRLDEPYLFGKRRWVKVKVWLSGVFEAVGYTKGTGKRADLFGALVLSNGTQVGSGFRDDELLSLLRWMVPTEYHRDTVDVMPFKVKVKYVEATNDGQLRFPIFEGLANA